MNNTTPHYLTIVSITLLFLIFMTGCSECNRDDPFNLNQLSFNRKINGSGLVTLETRAVSNFSEVILSEKGDLFIEVGDREALIVEAEENLQEYLFGKVENNILLIYKSPENVTLLTTQPIKYHLTIRKLNNLIVQNSGDVSISEISGETFSLRITGSGNVYINKLRGSTLNAELTSSGGLEIGTGKVDSQFIHLSSSGDYRGGNVKSQTTLVELSSSGTATVNVIDTLTVDLSSSGDVLYLGDPMIEVINISSTGKVKRVPQSLLLGKTLPCYTQGNINKSVSSLAGKIVLNKKHYR